MRIAAKFAAMLLALSLCLCLALPALAVHQVPDLTEDCSVTVTLKDGTTTVKGGTFTITRVGYVEEDNGDFFFSPEDDFRSHDLSDLSDKSLAKDLAKTAKSEKTDHQASKSPSSGKVTFSGLTPGLYLIQNTKACTGYQLGDPFLVSLPYWDGDEYLYDLTADAKMALEREMETTKPTGDLPQTGQLNWPIPAMAMLGLTLIVVGVALRRGKKHDA